MKAVLVGTTDVEDGSTECFKCGSVLENQEYVIPEKTD